VWVDVQFNAQSQVRVREWPTRDVGFTPALIVISTGVVAVPPIGITSGDCPTTEPIAVAGGIVIRSVDPDPRAIAEYPMPLELVVVVAVYVLAFPIVLALPVVTGVLAFPTVVTLPVTTLPVVTGVLTFPILTAT
jgi:hypothetical protein